MKKTFLAAACIFTVVAAEATTVNWSAANDTGFATANGTVLSTGNLLRLGYFTISDAQVALLAIPTPANLTALNTAWHVIADSTVGSGTGVAGSTSNASSVTLASGDFSHQIYIWALNASTVVGASQQAIFYEPSTTLPSWNLPGSNGPTISTTIDIGEAKTPGGTYLAGSYQASNASVTTTFNTAGLPGTKGAVLLQAIPEPSTLAFCVLAAIGATGSRRRSRSNRVGGAAANLL